MFDLDGLLVDSEDAWGVAERRVVTELGHPWDPEIRTLLLGKGPEDAARTLASHLGDADVETVDRMMLEAAVAEFGGGIVLRPGAEEVLAQLRGVVPLAVATNSRRVLADLALTSAGVAAAFDAVVAAEDVARPKPLPDPYREACRRVGADPRVSVGLEDSPVGVASAKAAGLWVVGCPSFPDVVLTGADVQVATLLEVDARAWFEAAA